MRRVARITGGERAVHEFTQLLGDAHAHADHRATRAKRWNHRIAFFQRQAGADRDRFLSPAWKSLRRDLPFVLPADQSFFEKPRDQHVMIKPRLDAALAVTFVGRFCEYQLIAS